MTERDPSQRHFSWNEALADVTSIVRTALVMSNRLLSPCERWWGGLVGQLKVSIKVKKMSDCEHSEQLSY